ncbi:MAG TPA: NlpC/P60 family protein [Xanthobacteraceae bacterium]|nr:NlpC/P60 family protein [Xanthobacteraceae bacterium]
MNTFDPRLTPARSDLAAKHLEGQVTAARFVEGVVQEIIDAQAPLRKFPSHEAPLDTEALMGEHVTVYEMTEEGWAWGQLDADGYVGWLPANALLAPGAKPTHKVVALRTFIFPGPSIKIPPMAAPSLGSRLTIVREDDRFAVTARGGYVPKQHLATINEVVSDPVAVAEGFVGVPYLWGGKTSLGLDCSGLVQLAFTACGIKAPRDTDMQEKAIGQAINHSNDLARLQRGDLIFWKGHVAMVRNQNTLIHANAFHMAVAIEPIATTIARIQASDGSVTSVRRVNIPSGGR